MPVRKRKTNGKATARKTARRKAPPHPALIDKHRRGFGFGYTAITKETDDVSLDFGIYVMKSGEVLKEKHKKETIWVLLDGAADLEWDGQKVEVRRNSLFDENPTSLHLSANTPVVIRAKTARVEWAVSRATNPKKLASRLYRPSDVQSEYRGKGLVQETCLRNVRLIFDYQTQKDSELVLGEVVNYPGKWSSYPPHHHDQPEIYHYRFTEKNGYGHGELGEEVLKLKNYDTVKITDRVDHSQCSAPGYGMYYLWVIRHLKNKPYTGFEFTDEHKWILDAKNQGWAPKG
ncbi:MAG TPA: 5-deoxy-glucuronate isomerase [Burkholderiales bacterium]|nr:5-deoxy-glucuronate isomerase [Burkholderiales bacterium]